MAGPIIAPYGAWKSPITSDLIVAESVDLGGPVVDGDDLYWLELRPREGGRLVIVRRAPDGTLSDVTPPPFNARTRVHEYGGGSFLVSQGVVYFSNFIDQRLYRQAPRDSPRPITPSIASEIEGAPGAPLRYADYVLDPRRGLLFGVREDHSAPGQPQNTLVKINAAGDEDGGQVIASGNDFYAAPRLSPDGQRLAWLTWNHPNMPWDGTELWVADVQADGALGQAQQVAGGLEESIFQPEWSPEGVLYFVSDRTGWWNLYRWRAGEIEALAPLEAEFGQPLWTFGRSTYTFESPEGLICTYVQRGQARLARLDTRSLRLEEIAQPYADISSVRAAPGRVLLLAGSHTEPWSLAQLDLATGLWEVLRRSTDMQVDPGYVSPAREIEFPTEGGLTAYGFFYAPRNKDYRAPEGARPPLVVMSHGGPTSATSPVFKPGIQYWTSRGIAVLDVNYGGSTGYGRAYRQRLNGQWGVVDVDDCVNGARYLAERGEVDGERLAIRGGSAGGYTTLAALTFRDVFKAGASHYGISDLETLAKDTHKFEARYLDKLVGPYPERRDLYVERSPIHFTHRLACAQILFQGLEDQVVPPDQAQQMFEAVRAKELPVAYLAFEGEQHGFRQAKNIKRALDAELYFYSKVFAFDLADPVEPVDIENL